MSSRSLIAGAQSRSVPSSWRRTSAGSSARNRIRPGNRTRSGSRSTRRDSNPASMRQRSPLAGTRSSGFPWWPVILLLLALQSAPGTPRVTLAVNLQSPRVRESSGVVLSRADRGAVRIRDARAVDWEDIALGPCPAAGGACLYIADTGDNEENRKSVVIYAVPEPDVPTGPADTARSARASALRLRYPRGPDDVEAIYLSPRDSALYLVGKGRRGAVHLYRVPRGAWRGDTVVTASLVQALPIVTFAALGRLVTGAGVRPDGRLVAIRTYAEIYFFVPGAGGRLAPSKRPVCNVAGLEVQGEAIDFLDDSTLVLTSEGGARTPPSLHALRCPG